MLPFLEFLTYEFYFLTGPIFAILVMFEADVELIKLGREFL